MADKDEKTEPDEAEEPADAGNDEDGEEGEAKPKPEPAAGGGKLSLIIAMAVIAVVAAGLGGFLGMQTSAAVEQAIADRAKAQPLPDRQRSAVFSGDMVLQALEPVITNLAQPTDTWIRLETAIVFTNGAVKNPQVTAAEIRQDILAYMRTISLAQLDGPSALQHIREDLNERVALRTGGEVSQLIIQSLIVQ